MTHSTKYSLFVLCWALLQLLNLSLSETSCFSSQQWFQNLVLWNHARCYHLLHRLEWRVERQSVNLTTKKRISFFTGNGNYTVTCFKKVRSFEVTEHDLWDDMKYRVWVIHYLMTRFCWSSIAEDRDSKNLFFYWTYAYTLQPWWEWTT